MDSTPQTSAGKNLMPSGMTHTPESGVELMALIARATFWSMSLALEICFLWRFRVSMFAITGKCLTYTITCNTPCSYALLTFSNVLRPQCDVKQRQTHPPDQSVKTCRAVFCYSCQQHGTFIHLYFTISLAIISTNKYALGKRL